MIYPIRRPELRLKRSELYPGSGGARVLTQGGHENCFGGAIFILDSGAEPAK